MVKQRKRKPAACKSPGTTIALDHKNAKKRSVRLAPVLLLSVAVACSIPALWFFLPYPTSDTLAENAISGTGGANNQPVSLAEKTVAELIDYLQLPAAPFDNDQKSFDLNSWTSRVDSAIIELQTDLPDSAEVVHLIGLTNLRLKRTKLAEPSFRQGLQLNPNHHQMRLDLAELLLQTGRDAEALEVLNAQMPETEIPVEYIARIGDCQQKLGDLTQAELSYKRACNSEPKNYVYFTKLATVQLQRQLPKEAEQNARAALELNDRSAEAWQVLGRTLAMQGETEQATAAFEQWRQMSSDSTSPQTEQTFEASYAQSMTQFLSSTFRSMGVLYIRSGHFDAAEKRLASAVELEPHDTATLSTFVTLHRGSGNLQAALAYNRLLLILESDQSVHYSNHANLSMAINDPVQAEAALRLGVLIMPENGSLQLTLARFLLLLGKSSEARGPAEEAVRLLGDAQSIETLNESLFPSELSRVTN